MPKKSLLSGLLRKRAGTDDDESKAEEDEDEVKAGEHDDDDDDAKSEAVAQEEDEEDEEDDDEPESKSARSLRQAMTKGARKQRIYTRKVDELCQIAGRPELAPLFRAEGVSLREVRAALIEDRASASKAKAISGQSGPEAGGSTTAMWDRVVQRCNARVPLPS